MTQAETPRKVDAAALESLAGKVGEFVGRAGPWATLAKLDALAAEERATLVVRGIREVVRSLIVRDLLKGENRLSRVPRLTPGFLADFERFDLTVQEGYLVSLIDGRSPLQSVLKLSPLDPFATLFAIATLRNKNVVEISP